jgi:isopenicillin N synthase-like dioxygenase
VAELPLIDISPLRHRGPGRDLVAEAIGRACREHGFFYVVGHGVDARLESRLDTLSRQFFALPEKKKRVIAMKHGGRAWRGYFPVGGELTSGKPDLKEGLYFGSELGPDDPSVRAGLPLHGANLFPAEPAELKLAVLEYLRALTVVGHTLMEGIALSLGLGPGYFADRYTADPLILFRIFHYPPLPAGADVWGVGEHTDYGVLTILKQDDCGGLEVKSPGGWIAAPPIAGSFVCNIGDMLDRMTGGRYRSTPHRVRNVSGRSRLSFPFFFDPNFHAEVKAIALTGAAPVRDDRDERWDGESVHAFQGTYGDYLLRKVAKVFPQLKTKLKR